jgi:DNA-binding CsgD family transcriptional regulator
MHTVELVAPLYLRPPGRDLSTKEKKDIKNYLSQSTSKVVVTRGIENLLTKLNSANSFEEIPDEVQFSYNNLIERNLDFKDTLELVKLTAKLAALRFGEKPKEIIFSGFATDTIDSDSYKKLNSAGFLGCHISPMIYGIEASAEVKYCIKKDPTYWNPIVIPEKQIITSSKSMPLEITLTFRQEQILKMICEKGMTNYQMSKFLKLSESTIKMHIGILLKKYGVQSRSQLIISYNHIKEKTFH